MDHADEFGDIIMAGKMRNMDSAGFYFARRYLVTLGTFPLMDEKGENVAFDIAIIYRRF